MKLYPPIYPGDSLLQPGFFSGDTPQRSRNAAAFPTPVVRRDMPAQSAPETGMGGAAVERQAGAARHAWVGSKLKSLYQTLVRKLEDAGQSEMEDYLAASQNLADLEARIRRYERMQLRNC
jgi:hypothetical protein